MSRFNQPIPSDDRPVVKIDVEGSFLCQTCGKDIDSAFYLPEAKILTWKCEDGHKSFIDKFEL